MQKTIDSIVNLTLLSTAVCMVAGFAIIALAALAQPIGWLASFALMTLAVSLTANVVSRS